MECDPTGKQSVIRKSPAPARQSPGIRIQDYLPPPLLQFKQNSNYTK